MLTIYHNPRCSKSRETLSLIEAAGETPEIIRYLETPLTRDQIATLLTKLNVPARELLRKGEAEYKEHHLADPALTDAQLIDFMAQYPKLIERPIVVKDDQAVLGRPPENVQQLL